jgi:hypothetical protein
MPKELVFNAKIYKTSDKKTLSTSEKKTYEYGAINIRSPDLAKFVGKKAKVIVKVE